MIDEILFGTLYRKTKIEKPLIIMSVPRAGTTSFHLSLALDENLISLRTCDTVLPFLCVTIPLEYLNKKFPHVLKRIESLLKRISGITKEVEQRHPVSFFSVEADDVLLGEWSWAGIGSVRSFPVLKYWWEDYNYAVQKVSEKDRIMKFHQLVCQKRLFSVARDNVKCKQKRLLLRSHLSSDGIHDLYQDAIFIGIVRNPETVLQSFAGLTDCVVYNSTGLRLLTKDTNNANTLQQYSPSNIQSWGDAMQIIVADMMEKQAKIHTSNTIITFDEFKNDPIAAISGLYERVGLEMTDKFVSNIASQLNTHWAYKKSRPYKNPTFEIIGVQKEAFMSLNGVQEYQALLQSRSNNVNKIVPPVSKNLSTKYKSL